MHRAGGQGKGLAVPMEYLEFRCAAVQPGAGGDRIDAAHRQPADFADGIGFNGTAEGLANELPAEAMAEHRPIRAHCRANEIERLRNPWQIVVDAHGAAHEHQAVVGCGGRWQRFAGIEAHKPVIDTVAREEVEQITRTFSGKMTRDQNFFHARFYRRRYRGVSSVLLLIGLLSSVSAVAVERIGVLALFKDKAILDIDGKRRVIAKGDTSPEGVTLIAADSEKATIEHNGRREVLLLGVVTGAFNKDTGPAAVTLWAQNNFFYAEGTINNQPVRFLVDTGASSIAMNSALAQRLGIDFRKGEVGVATTASGYARIYRVTLNRVKIGEIELFNVQAGVIDGPQPATPLLGMSFLGSVEMRRDGDRMDLIKRY